jgi:hypothetical protein
LKYKIFIILILFLNGCSGWKFDPITSDTSFKQSCQAFRMNQQAEIICWDGKELCVQGLKGEALHNISVATCVSSYNQKVVIP